MKYLETFISMNVFFSKLQVIKIIILISRKTNPCGSNVNVLEKLAQEVSNVVPGVDAVGTIQHYDYIHILLTL